MLFNKDLIKLNSMKIIKLLFLALIPMSLCYSAQQKNKKLVDVVMKGNTKLVQELLEDKSIDINVGAPYWTPLMGASDKGNQDIAKILLDHGADVNARGGLGFTSLMAASEAGHLEMVKLLVDQGADVSIKNVNGDNALECAKRHYDDILMKIKITLNAATANHFKGCIYKYKKIIKFLETQNEYLLYKEERIKELNRELTNILRTSSFPEVLIEIVKSYSSNDFMKFSQFFEQKEKKDIIKESNVKTSQDCFCVIQ